MDDGDRPGQLLIPLRVGHCAEAETTGLSASGVEMVEVRDDLTKLYERSVRSEEGGAVVRHDTWPARPVFRRGSPVGTLRSRARVRPRGTSPRDRRVGTPYTGRVRIVGA